MAEVGERAAKQLTKITECPICMSDFTDPRMLPCIHTFCFECLKRTGEEAQMKPGEKMPCPLCRKEFIIPVDGMNGVQKNFFMENFLEFKSALEIESACIIFCDMCKLRGESKTGEIPASMRCLECQENYCYSCVKVHQLQHVSRTHQMMKIGKVGRPKSEINPSFSKKCCNIHATKQLDYYCSDCKKIVCVSCFVESHKSHDCKDVNTVDEEFRQTIEKKEWLISNYAEELISMITSMEKRKENFLKEIFDSENAIHRRNQQLKDLIDRDTKSLLDELSVIKSKHLKQIESEMTEIDRSCTIILKSFEAYCTELRLKGSASDICSSVDQLLARADYLERDREAIIGPPHKSVEVSFQAADLLEVAQKSKKSSVGERKVAPLPHEITKVYDTVQPTDDLFNLNRRDIVLTRELGGGRFGAVMLGEYRHRNKTVPVAIKMLKQADWLVRVCSPVTGLGVSTAEEELMMEARLMANLSNPFIIRMIGVCRSDSIMLVLELAPLGPLNKYLKKVPETSVQNITELMWQVAQGMAYLESRNFVHRDLAARSVLLANEHLAKISDFGMSKELGIGNEYYTAEEAGHWPLKWYAPECIYDYKFNSKSDVWSYGVTLWEAMSYGAMPYRGMTGAEIVEMLDNEKRLDKPDKCSQAMYDLMLKCWQRNSEDRPTFQQIARQMGAFQ